MGTRRLRGRFGGLYPDARTLIDDHTDDRCGHAGERDSAG